MNFDPIWLAWASPLVLFIAFIASAAVRSVERAWRAASIGAAASLASALLAAAVAAWNAFVYGQRADALGLTMALLIALLGWVIVRYSRTYLHGEAAQGRYVRSLLFTLAAVSVVPLTTHLGVIALAWIASSLGLHSLLTFYRERPAAVIVAHKKFLASRVAEVCLLAALLLIYRETGSLNIEGIAAHLAEHGESPLSLHAAAALIALAAIFKSAQLPVHGWLIQVMEAPTPVSALLHAGIVNLGGFVLIRVAPLLSEAPLAQWMLIVVGSLTAVLAGLVMMTRISIKVRLAWSTCAQMGFMLLECGLGLYELALLHLVAHSIYKAYAFLSAGETVQVALRRRMQQAAGRPSAPNLAVHVLAGPIALAAVFGSFELWRALLPDLQLPFAAALLVALGLAPLLWTTKQTTAREWVQRIVRMLLIAQLYLAWHTIFMGLAPTPALATPWPQLLWVGACFFALYGVQIWMVAFPQGALSRGLYPWAYAGFYLDERFTRLTFRLWPAQQPARRSAPPSAAAGQLIGERV